LIPLKTRTDVTLLETFGYELDIGMLWAYVVGFEELYYKLKKA